MAFPTSLVKEIADRVSHYETCYVEKSTFNCFFFPKDEDMRVEYFNALEDEDVEEEDKKIYEDIEKNPQNYYIIDVMPSFEGYKMMEKLVEQTSDSQLREKLEQALNGRNPFANFRQIVLQERPKEWYAFQATHTESFVERELKRQTG